MKYENTAITNPDNVMLHEIMTEKKVVENDNQALIVFSAFDFEYKGVKYDQVEFQLNRNLKQGQSVFLKILVLKDGVNYKTTRRISTGCNGVAFRTCARILRSKSLNDYEKF